MREGVDTGRAKGFSPGVRLLGSLYPPTPSLVPPLARPLVRGASPGSPYPLVRGVCRAQLHTQRAATQASGESSVDLVSYVEFQRNHRSVWVGLGGQAVGVACQLGSLR